MSSIQENCYVKDLYHICSVRKDDVIIGGTKDAHNEDLVPKQSDRDGIWQRAFDIMPSLKVCTKSVGLCTTNVIRQKVYIIYIYLHS